MATNGRKDGYRHGAVKSRSQFYNSRTGLWVKRGTNGRIMDVKTSGGRFKGIRREK